MVDHLDCVQTMVDGGINVELTKGINREKVRLAVFKLEGIWIWDKTNFQAYSIIASGTC